jgi:hypothetical protein
MTLTKNQIRYQRFDRVIDQLYDQVSNQVIDQVRNQMWYFMWRNF